MGKDGQEAGALLLAARSITRRPTRSRRTPQQFSDDEGEADQPLAPLQPEDLVEVDDEMDQDEAAGSTAPDMTPGPMSRDVSEPAPSRPSKEGEDDGLSKPATPKPHPLSISFQPPTPTPVPDEDELLPPQEDVVDMRADMDADMAPDFGADMSLDMAGMGPDGEQFEGAEDMSQLQSADPLLGGPLINEEIGDPFAVPPA